MRRISRVPPLLCALHRAGRVRSHTRNALCSGADCRCRLRRRVPQHGARVLPPPPCPLDAGAGASVVVSASRARLAAALRAALCWPRHALTLMRFCAQVLTAGAPFGGAQPRPGVPDPQAPRAQFRHQLAVWRGGAIWGRGSSVCLNGALQDGVATAERLSSATVGAGEW